MGHFPSLESPGRSNVAKHSVTVRCPEVPAIQSSLTIRTRSFYVNLYNISDGRYYTGITARGGVWGEWNADNKVELRLTSHRLAAMANAGEGVKIFVWNLGNLKAKDQPRLVSRSIPLSKIR